MNQILLTLFAFSFFWSGGQREQDYTLYHEKIVVIEEHNARGSFDSSLAMYYDIFNKYNRVLARDAYNACQLSALKKSKHFAHYFYVCAKSGITKPMLLNNYLIGREYKLDSNNLNTLYANGLKEYLNRIDTTLRNEMILRFNNEQKSKGKENYSKICTDNFNRIFELSKEGRFPGEDIIGNDDDLESIILPTLCHYPYSYRILEPYLTDALNKGKTTPISLLYLYSFNQTRRSILYTSNIPSDTTNFNIDYNMPFGRQSNNLEEVDKQRSIRNVIPLAVQKSLKNFMARYGIDYRIGY
jgi:hypothetical protein